MKKLIPFLVIGTMISVSAGESSIMKSSRYIDIMDKVLSAYTIEHIDRYYNDVYREGLTEQGFCRLTANIGILIANGKRQELMTRFIKMMDLCCEEIPKHKYASNEFSVKEIIFCLLELEKHQTLPQKQIDRWKASMKDVTVENCYQRYAEKPDSIVYNWAAFAMVSEWMRYYINAAPKDMTFIENQAASQWQWVDENGMYKEPNQPIVYDLVTRGLFALIFHCGYRGEYFERWDDALKRSGLCTLKMVSVTGEGAYGGRSNQFLHNEAHVALVLEYEAARYAKLGDMKKASQFRGAVKKALDNIELWLKQEPIRHIKNAFPRESGYGCESYAYFDKYMITTASFLYVAYLLSDDSIPAAEPDYRTGESWKSSDDFHKLFLRAGEYCIEYDYDAFVKYDVSGLGRLHRKNAPAAICISTPGPAKPSYVVNAKKVKAFSITPEILHNGKWLSSTAGNVIHKVIKHSAEGETASAQIDCRWQNGAEVKSFYFLDKNGLQITLEGNGDIALMLPAFSFDGTEKTEITNSGNILSIKYKNWVCRYKLDDGVIKKISGMGYNRNGHYQLFRATGKNRLKISVSITPAE